MAKCRDCNHECTRTCTACLKMAVNVWPCAKREAWECSNGLNQYCGDCIILWQGYDYGDVYNICKYCHLKDIAKSNDKCSDRWYMDDKTCAWHTEQKGQEKKDGHD